LKEENQQIKSSDEPPIDYNEFYEQVWPLLVERVPSFRTAKVSSLKKFFFNFSLKVLTVSGTGSLSKIKKFSEGLCICKNLFL